MKQSFYRAFEDKYRGSRETIRARLEHYAPFIYPLQPEQGAPAPVALDLGCGRGEWMELLRDWGFDTHGVDLDAGMLQACRDLGLKVAQQDALSYLRSLPDASQMVVSAFHVVEHISFEILETLVDEALRVLQPGGLLVLETPNPENLIVGTERFYLDPTHTQPIPHLLLSFLLEHRGFGRVKVLPLQEPEGIQKKAAVGLYDVITGASPDYAVVGQKNAPGQASPALDHAFSASYGQDLLGLALRFDARQDAWSTMQQTVAQLVEQLQDVEARRVADTHRLQKQIQQQMQQMRNASNQLSSQMVSRAQELEDALRAMHASTSWRVTAPLRALSRGLQRLLGRNVPAAASPVRASNPMMAVEVQEAVEADVDLSPTGREVYRNLRHAREASKPRQ